MIRSLLLSFMLSCGSDVSIMKQNTPPSDTSTSTIDTSPDTDTQDTNTDTSTSIDYSLVSGHAEIHFRQIACPACVGEPSEFDITAELKIHQPTAGDYFDALTPVGTCKTNIYDSYVSSQPLTATQSTYFNEIQLNPSGQGTWLNSTVYEYQYSRNTFYRVSTEHGVIENAFQTLEGFDSIEPYTLLWVDPSYAFDAIISKSSTYFTWTPVVPNSQFEIIVVVYSPDGTQMLGAVSCMENDVGYMNFPGSYFQSYPSWSLTAVHLIRHRTGLVEAPEIQGSFSNHMMWEVVGTGHIE